MRPEERRTNPNHRSEGVSIYSRVKCTPEELLEFKKKVLAYLIANGIDLTTITIRFQKNYGGNAKVFTYKTEMRNNKISRRYLTAEKDGVEKDGWYKGHFDTCMQMGVYFYREEWEDYFKPEMADNRKWDLEDIKKHIEIRKIRKEHQCPSTTAK
jgi:hypothetical protein